MRLLETGWLEIGHDQFHHLGRGGGRRETEAALGTAGVSVHI